MSATRQIEWGDDSLNEKLGTKTCPLCGMPNIPESQLPRHISSEQCNTDAKTVRYE
ncbi:hypothetical protein ACLI4U_19170 (plasmid) [Natrialbaceae archaeon A-CW2]